MVPGPLPGVNGVPVLQVGHCYLKELSDFPKELTELLLNHHTVLDTDLRMVGAVFDWMERRSRAETVPPYKPQSNADQEAQIQSRMDFHWRTE